MSDSTDAENALAVSLWQSQEFDADATTDACAILSGFFGEARQRCAIAAAEDVVRERGLGEQYGLALARELGMHYEGESIVVASNIAELATAPLPARLAALAAVAREVK